MTIEAIRKGKMIMVNSYEDLVEQAIEMNDFFRSYEGHNDDIE